MTRAEKAKRAQELRAEGLTVRQISERMGIPRSTAGDLLKDPTEAVLRRVPPCPDCGRLGWTKGTLCAMTQREEFLETAPRRVGANTQRHLEAAVADLKRDSDRIVAVWD